MNYKCEKCDHRFPIDVRVMTPHCVNCGTIAVRLEVSGNDNHTRLARHPPTRSSYLEDILLFLAALLFIDLLD